MKIVLKLLATIVFVLTVSFFYFFYNYQFWTHYKTDNFKVLIEYDGENIRGLRGRQVLIHKDFKKYMMQIDQYANTHNIELIINQSFRSDHQIISRAVVKPGRLSNHLAGFAIDFNIISNGKKYLSNELRQGNLKDLPSDIQNFINDIRKNKSLRWGGDFQKEDPIHIDHPLNFRSKENWNKFSKDCAADYEKRIPKWKIWKS
ncbi:M15 family metallopeptidase [Flammeovirga sp. SJP92]|uniref:M15 family metallopeptidase n=1 Tax=Flammeovirga sp. SJP92 TaxID=1775430 RepID=UPI000788CAC5|nr:M15 family metallopeptidase [Flammeovirga sp. SJP92]KXX66623.1 hypothetical protein AVL50_31505 [Flammeovirga sp. SJP92]